MIRDTTPEKVGIYPQVPAAEYHSWRAFSISSGLELLKSPGHYMHRLLTPLEQTEPMRFGTLVHERLLEPGFWERYVVMPDLAAGLCDEKGNPYKNPRATNKYKALVEDWSRDNPGKVPLDARDAERVERIYEQAMRKSVVSELLGGVGQSELSMLWEEGGWLRCKGRMDRVDTEGKILIDIKTTGTSGIEAFVKAIVNRGQYIQLGHYRAGARALGMEIDHAIIIAVETKEPFGVVAITVPEVALKAGEKHREELFNRLKRAQLDDKWEVYPDTLVTPEFPDWAFSSIERALGYF